METIRAALLAVCVAVTVSVAGCSSSSGATESMDKYCWRGSTPLPKCDDGSFRYWDKLCTNMAGSEMCSEHGDGRCYPFCDSNGGCAQGSTCGEISLFRCTHYCMETVRVCLPGAEAAHRGCTPDQPHADAGRELVADTGLAPTVDAGP
ncbi:MAG: hypothetical protein QM765_28655 [Myxococcales bacterium]